MRAPRAVALVALLVLGCGGSEDGAGAARPRDPTLRGLVARLEEAGLAVGPKQAMGAREGQRAAVGRAAGLANELAGAGLKSNLAIETQQRTLAGAQATLKRFANEGLARDAHDALVRNENRAPDAGKLVPFLLGEYTIVLEGPPGRPPPGVSPGLVEVRPAAPPAPAAVEAVQQALATLRQ